MKPLVCNPFFFLISLCSAWMIGIGLRMIIDGYMNNSLYRVNMFDMVFDWGTLVILGMVLFVVGVFKAYQDFKKIELDGGDV